MEATEASVLMPQKKLWNSLRPRSTEKDGSPLRSFFGIGGEFY